MTKIITRVSPNHGPRPSPVSAVVLHATADSNTPGAVEWCCTPKPRNPNPVSYHAIIDRDGTLYSLVDVKRRAWHAGYSLFGGVYDVNDFAIGVSFGNRNNGKEPYPEVQLAVGAALIATYMHLYPAITIDRITTHAVVRTAWHAANPGRTDVAQKTDPMPPAFSLEAFKVRVLAELARTA
jgi:N-acetylmuramoyl-L-alanine amidase